LAVLWESVCPYRGVGCRLRVEGTPRCVTRIRGVETAAADLADFLEQSPTKPLWQDRDSELALANGEATWDRAN
jgi:hypothetical protein